MKLIIQIPCLNEERTIQDAIRSLPRHIDGIDTIEVLVIDDGSSDDSAARARQAGAQVVSLPRHMGLASAFSEGVKVALEHGADILVNTDADLQYPSEYIPFLVKPILEGRAEIAIGDRLNQTPAPFPPGKMALERLGSWFVKSFSGVPVKDAASGFRAFGKEAMEFMFLHGRFSYTLETLVMAGMLNLRIANVPITSKPTNRPSRLFSSVPHYITQSMVSVLRAYLMYYPLKFFVSLGSVFLAGALLLGSRFLVFYFLEDGAGHVQSLILTAILATFGVLCMIVGMIGDVVAANRRLLEDLRLCMTRRNGNGEKESMDLRDYDEKSITPV